MNLDMLSSAVLNPRTAQRGFRSKRPFLDHHRGHGQGDVSSLVSERLGGDFPSSLNFDFAHENASIAPPAPENVDRQRLPGERGYWGMLGEAMTNPNKSFWDVKREYEGQRAAAAGRNASIEALRSAGAPENWLTAAEHNPKVMETLITRYMAEDGEADFTGMVSSEDFAWVPGGPDGEENKTVSMLRNAGYNDTQIGGVLRVAQNGNMKPLNHMLKQAITGVGQGASWQTKEVSDGQGGTKLVAINPKNPRQVMDLGLTGAKKGPMVEVNNMPGADKFDDEMAKLYAKNTMDVLQQGSSARTQMAEINRLEQALNNPDVYTGKGGQLVLSMKKSAQALGMDVEGVDDAEMANAITNKMALMFRNPDAGFGMPGAMSDKDREFLMSLPPGLGKSREGNKKIAEYYRKVYQRKMDIANLAREWMRDNNGRIDYRFYAEVEKFANANPMFDGEAATFEDGGNRTDDDILKQYGINQ